jgi:hypothetical protein
MGEAKRRALSGTAVFETETLRLDEIKGVMCAWAVTKERQYENRYRAAGCGFRSFGRLLRWIGRRNRPLIGGAMVVYARSMPRSWSGC